MCVCVCVRGRGGGDGAGERGWMIANVLPACYMQMPNISKTRYEQMLLRDGALILMLRIYTNSAFWLSHKII